jgi:hypothetical protein
MKIAVVGTGYVGLVTGACLADVGIQVTCVDIDEKKIANLHKGILPIYEPGLDEIVERNYKAGRLHFSTNLAESIQGAEAAFCAVGTPPGEDGSADLKYVLAVAKEIGENMNDYIVVITKSTVPVGTAEKVRNELTKALEVRGADIPFDVASNPEFLKEGAAVDDFMKPDRIVVGVESDRARDVMERLYRPFVLNGHPVIFMDTGAQGFSAFKVRAGSEMGRDRDEWPGRTEAIVPAMRHALPDADLLIDANSCYSVPRAIAVGRLLEDHGFCHFEEPCPYWDLDATKRVADALAIDVTGGEQDCQLSTWQRMIAMRAVDIVQPDILYLGGIARTLRVCRMAAAAGLPVTPHCANLSMVTLFTHHLLRAIPNAGRYLEFSIEGPEYYPWQYGLFAGNPYRIEAGQAQMTDAPGWGVEIAPEWLARAAYRCSDRASAA